MFRHCTHCRYKIDEMHFNDVKEYNYIRFSSDKNFRTRVVKSITRIYTCIFLDLKDHIRLQMINIVKFIFFYIYTLLRFNKNNNHNDNYNNNKHVLVDRKILALVNIMWVRLSWACADFSTYYAIEKIVPPLINIIYKAISLSRL